MNIPRTSRSAALLAAALSCCALASCNKQSEHEQSTPDRIFHDYTVRGEVVAPASSPDGLRVRHEAIPEYVRPGGSRGMNVMVMTFWPPQGDAPEDLDRETIEAQLAPLETGDKVEFTFRVWLEDETYKPEGYWINAVTVLPDDTQLDWTPLESPTESPETGASGGSGG